MKKPSFVQIFTIVFLLISIITLLKGFYTIYIQKNFNYIIETNCNPEMEKCFVRDCLIDGACPPNGFDKYKKYIISAKKFEYCSENSCIDICSQESSLCKVIQCGDSSEDICSESK